MFFTGIKLNSLDIHLMRKISLAKYMGPSTNDTFPKTRVSNDR